MECKLTKTNWKKNLLQQNENKYTGKINNINAVLFMSPSTIQQKEFFAIKSIFLL